MRRQRGGGSEKMANGVSVEMKMVSSVYVFPWTGLCWLWMMVMVVVGRLQFAVKAIEEEN